MNRLSAWQKVQKSQEQYWKRFSQEDVDRTARSNVIATVSFTRTRTAFTNQNNMFSEFEMNKVKLNAFSTHSVNFRLNEIPLLLVLFSFLIYCVEYIYFLCAMANRTTINVPQTT